MPQNDARDRGRLLPLLKEMERKEGYLSRESIDEIATSLSLPLGEVFGTATFYSFFPIEPTGKHVIRICKSVPCHLKDAEMIIETVGKELGISPGETTTDKRFSFELTNCIGACDQSPAMMINDEVYGSLTADRIDAILKSFDNEGGREAATDE